MNETKKLDVLRELMIDLGGIALDGEDLARHGFISACVAAVMAIDVLRDNDVTDAGDLAEFVNVTGDKAGVIREIEKSAILTRLAERQRLDEDIS